MKIETIKQEINKQIADKDTFNTLLQTTFKGLVAQTAKQAMLEGMMRGFTFENFLQKDIYAIPFKAGYSLVTSIDYARKIGMRSGVVGKSAPLYEFKDEKIISCTVTVKKKVDDYVGDYTATVFFDEYNTGYNLWKTKPKTMIAKVAEMHALRMACPEELSQMYIEEDMEKEVVSVEVISDELKTKIENCKDVKELKTIWKESEGLGKDFISLLTAKKQKLENETA